MSQKIKVKIIDIEKLEFELCQDAKKGDTFSLSESNDIDYSYIIRELSEGRSRLFNDQLLKEKDNWKNEFKASQEYLSLSKKINDLENENKLLSNSINEKISIAETKKENELLKNFNENIERINLELNSKNAEINELKNSFNDKIKNIELENEKKHSNKINELSNQLNLKDKEIENINLSIQNRIEKEKADIEKIYNEKISILKEEHIEKINDIERKRRFTTKSLGEELENFISSEYNNYFGIISDCDLSKTNKSIEGTKPDFLFKVFNPKTNDVLGSVTIEAKTQQSVSESSKKNKDHFSKLERDRKNNFSEYSLLISELEPTDDFLIKKVNDPNYENMFVVRPSYFIPFLSLIRFIFLEKSKISTLQLDLKKKNEILEEFESLKNAILDNSIKNIESKVSEIIKNANNIKDSANKILSAAETVADKHLNTVRSKIESFKINKITKEIDSLKSNE